MWDKRTECEITQTRDPVIVESVYIFTIRLYNADIFI